MIKNQGKRFFILGDSWLYYKIYCGVEMADVILKTIIKPSMDFLIKKKVVEKWFFVRYTDPEFNIRLRIYSDCHDNLGEIVHYLLPHFDYLIEHDLVWKLQTDIYERELERYGLSTISLAEDFFCLDSDMIVSFLDLLEGVKGEEVRWLFSLTIINNLLNSFKLNIHEKYLLMETLKIGFGKEFGMNRFLKKQIDAKYREKQKQIEDALKWETWGKLEYVPMNHILKNYENKLYPLSEEILTFEQKGILEVQLHDLLGSFIHMSMNRLFKSKNRVNEMVCYDFLYRYYKSEIARQKYENKNV